MDESNPEWIVIVMWMILKFDNPRIHNTNDINHLWCCIWMNQIDFNSTVDGEYLAE